MPSLYILGGPNGAGKTTAAMTLLPEFLHVKEFVNADEIARGLSPFNVEGAAIEAGRLMLKRLEHLAAEKQDFAFETTLASKGFARFIERLKREGYEAHLMYVWLPQPEMSIERVKLRVSRGGHHIPDDVVRRRYHAGISNLFELYLPTLDTCHVFDNSCAPPKLLAKYTNEAWIVEDQTGWKRFEESRHAS